MSPTHPHISRTSLQNNRSWAVFVLLEGDALFQGQPDSCAVPVCFIFGPCFFWAVLFFLESQWTLSHLFQEETCLFHHITKIFMLLNCSIFEPKSLPSWSPSLDPSDFLFHLHSPCPGLPTAHLSTCFSTRPPAGLAPESTSAFSSLIPCMLPRSSPTTNVFQQVHGR